MYITFLFLVIVLCAFVIFIRFLLDFLNICIFFIFIFSFSFSNCLTCGYNLY